MPVKRKVRTSDKVIAAVLPLFSAWCARYAWGWLAGLEAIAAAGLAAWKITNVPADDRVPVTNWGQKDAAEAGQAGVLTVIALALLCIALLVWLAQHTTITTH